MLATNSSDIATPKPLLRYPQESSGTFKNTSKHGEILGELRPHRRKANGYLRLDQVIKTRLVISQNKKWGRGVATNSSNIAARKTFTANGRHK